MFSNIVVTVDRLLMIRLSEGDARDGSVMLINSVTMSFTRISLVSLLRLLLFSKELA